MTLDRYLAKHELSEADFAIAIGRNQSTVNRLRRGLTLPDWETIAKISAATGGAVKANDFARAVTEPEQREAAQ